MYVCVYIYIYIYIYIHDLAGSERHTAKRTLDLSLRCRHGLLLYHSCAGYTINSTTYVSEIHSKSMISPFPVQVLCVSSDFLKCRLLKCLLAHPMNYDL